MLLVKVATPLKEIFSELSKDELVADLPSINTDKNTTYLRRAAGIASDAVNGYLQQFPKEILSEKAEQIRSLANDGQLRQQYDAIFDSYSEENFKKELRTYFAPLYDDMNVYLAAYALKKLPTVLEEKKAVELACKALELMPDKNVKQKCKKIFAGVAGPMVISGKVKKFYQEIDDMTMPEAAEYVKNHVIKASHELPEEHGSKLYDYIKDAAYGMVDKYEAGIVEENALIELASLAATHLEYYAHPEKHLGKTAFDDDFMKTSKALIKQLNPEAPVPEKPISNDNISTATNAFSFIRNKANTFMK